jgi:hypothetical protein
VKRLKKFRGITRLSNGEYVDRYVEGYSRGELKKPQILKEVIYARYKCIGVLSGDAVEDGVRPPRHDAVFIDPMVWTYHYLRRIR